MTENRVQIAIRTTKEQRDEIREMALAKDVTINQFIIDAIFSDITDSNSTIDDSTVISLLERQLEQKDKQIEKMQSLLDQQQKLTLQTNQQIQYLQLENEQSDEITEVTRKKKSPGFFSWFKN